MEIWTIITPIITAAIASISAFAVSWISNHYNYKNTKLNIDEKNKLEHQKKEAEDLNDIIYPAIYSLDIEMFSKYPNQYNVYWLINYLTLDDCYSFESDFKTILLNNKLNINSKDASNVIYQTLIEKYDLVAFLKRYNIGKNNIVTLDLAKLNNDIKFVNEHLGKHYELFKEV